MKIKKLVHILGSAVILIVLIYLGSKYDFVARLLLGALFLSLFIVPIVLYQFKSKRKWYKKKRFVIPLILLAILYLISPEIAVTLSYPLYIVALISLLIFIFLLIYINNENRSK